MATRPMTQDMEEEGDTRLERSFSALESKQNFPFAKCKHCIYTILHIVVGRLDQGLLLQKRDCAV